MIYFLCNSYVVVHTSVGLSESVPSLEMLDQDRPLLRRAVPAKKSPVCSTVETVVDYTENKMSDK